jgi:hypothetical protein
MIDSLCQPSSTANSHFMSPAPNHDPSSTLMPARWFSATVHPPREESPLGLFVPNAEILQSGVSFGHIVCCRLSATWHEATAPSQAIVTGLMMPSCCLVRRCSTRALPRLAEASLRLAGPRIVTWACGVCCSRSGRRRASCASARCAGRPLAGQDPSSRCTCPGGW